MIDGRAVPFAFGYEGAVFLRCGRPLHYLMEGYLVPLMADSHTPVDQILHHDLLRTDPVLYLIERPVVLDRVVILEGPFRLDAENGIEIDVFDRAVQVLFLFRSDTEAPVIDREVGGEESVSILDRAHAP